MKNYVVSSNFCKFFLINDSSIKIEELKKYFYTYINIEECLEKEVDDKTIHLVLRDIQDKEYDNDCYNEEYLVDLHKLCLKNRKIILFLNGNNDILFLKRFIIDITNKIIEKNGGVFLHGSTVIKNGKSIIFTGDKMSGKTNNMLFMLKYENFNYSSNEKVAIIKKDNTIYSYGCPSNINIRLGTLKYNKVIYNKLKSCINNNDYKNKLNDLEYTKEDRLIFTAFEIAKSFNREIESTGNLKCICNLTFLPEVDFLMRELTEKEKLIVLKKNLISGVYPTRKEIFDKIISQKENMPFEDLSNIKCYNIWQNNKNSNANKILARIKEDLK